MTSSKVEILSNTMKARAFHLQSSLARANIIAVFLDYCYKINPILNVWDIQSGWFLEKGFRDNHKAACF